MAGSSETPALLNWLATLSDMARLRTLRLLGVEELSVGELAKILQLPQSTVSRHLKLLTEGGWLSRRTVGTASLYRMALPELPAGARELWEFASAQLQLSPTVEDDNHRLSEVLAERRADGEAFFGRLGGEWDAVRRDLFGDAFAAEAMLGLLNPDWVVADLGCGTGSAAELIAPIVKRVIEVDREPAMLDAARKRLASWHNVEFRQGEITETPIGKSEVDAAITSLVLVYLDKPESAVREMGRILRPGGAAMIVDLVAHDRESYRQTMGHRHLGFGEADVRAWADDAGLGDVRYRRLRPDTDAKGPGLFVATMRRK